MLGAHAAAQTADDQLRFEVASIKAHVDGGDARAGIEENEGFVRIVNLPLRTVIAIAYDVRETAWVTGMALPG
jgi:uncharacterized protein (TIGR03435 family)